MAELEMVKPKSKPVKATAEAIGEDALGELIDLYCSLRVKMDPEIAAFKIKMKELEEVEKQLLGQIDELHPADEEATRKTALWLLAFGMKGNSFVVTNKQKLIELLGLSTFIELAEVGVTDLRSHLTAQQLDQVGMNVRKTKRKLEYAPNKAK